MDKEDFQIELYFQHQQKMKEIRSKPIILDAGICFIKSFGDHCEYYIRKKVITNYYYSFPFTINGGMGNKNLLEDKKVETFKDFLVNKQEWLNYKEIEIVDEQIAVERYSITNLPSIKCGCGDGILNNSMLGILKNTEINYAMTK